MKLTKPANVFKQISFLIMMLFISFYSNAFGQENEKLLIKPLSSW
jgi:hypothetical protein